MIELFDDVLFTTGPNRFVQEFFGLGHADLFRWIGLLGDTWGVMLALGVAFWLYDRDTAYAVVGSIALGAVTKMLITMAFHMPRPAGPGIVVYEDLGLGSFPSGHVYQTLIPWALLSVRENLPMVIPAAIAVAVAISRMYLGAHYLVDVVAAALLGVAFVAAYNPLWNAVKDWFYRRSVWFYGALTALGAGGVLASIALRVDTPRRWEILGIVIGVGIALIVERKMVQYEPPSGRRLRLLALAAGFLGYIPFGIASRLMEEAAMAAYVALACGLMLWTLLGAPILIDLLRGEPSDA